MKKGTCKFYNGDHHNTHCLAGVCYADVTTGTKDEPGSAFRKPCIDWEKFKGERGVGAMSEGQRREWERRGACAKREEPTQAEIDAYEAEWAKHMEKIKLGTVLVSELKKKHDKSWQGVETCPACKGNLHVRINVFFSEYQNTRQKHAHVKCATEGCIAWME